MKNPAQLQSELFDQLSEPCIGEALFDCLADLVFFIKNRRGEYVVVNHTLVQRCGRSAKSDLIGRRADEVFPEPLGRSYRVPKRSLDLLLWTTRTREDITLREYTGQEITEFLVADQLDEDALAITQRFLSASPSE